METPRKKILYVITKSNMGGAQRYVYDLATSLPVDRFEVTVALGGNGMLAEKLADAHIRVISLPHLGRDVRLLEDFKAFHALYKLFRAEQPDIVHLNSSKIGGLGGLAARLARVPRILFTAHGWAFNEHRSPAEQGFIKAMAWVTLMLAHQTIAVSYAIATQVATWPLVARRITVIHLGARTPTFLSRARARTALSKYSLRLAARLRDSSPKWIGAVAELHPIKGLDTALEVMRELNKERTDCILVILGEGEERAKLEGRIESMKLQDSVYLLGYVDEANQYLKALDVFLLLSYSEALNYALLEASAAALPVVATKVGGIPEVVVDGANGFLIPPRDARAAAERINTILSHSKQARSFAETAETVARERFPFERMLEETCTRYEMPTNSRPISDR